MAVFESGDIIRLRQFSRGRQPDHHVNRLTVSSYVDQGDGTQRWNVHAPPAQCGHDGGGCGAYQDLIVFSTTGKSGNKVLRGQRY